METPKEKAIELFEKNKIFASGLLPKFWEENTKAICINTVNEVLLALSDIESTKDGTEKYRFYEEVLNELNKL